MRHVTRLTALTLVIVSFFVFAATALAAPVAWEQVEVTLHSEQSGGVMLVAGDLPADAKLPAQVDLAVPAGSTLMWIGELLGGPSSEDPKLEYTKSTVGGADIYSVTMTKGRSAQIEIAAPADASADGVNYTSSVSWVPATDVARVLISARIPANANVVQAVEGASVIPSDATYAFYSKKFENVKAGEPLSLKFAYATTGAPVPVSGTPASSGSDSILIIAMLFAAAVGVALVVVLARTKMAGRTVRTEPQPAPKRAQSVAAEARVAAPATGSDEDEAFEQPDAAEADASDSAPRSRGMKPQAILAGVVVLVLAVFVWVVVVQAAKPKVVGDTISQIFAGGEPCEIASIAVAAPGGADPVGTAETLFAALKTAEGINDAKYTISSSTLQVGFCGSQTTEDAVRGALAPTGLVGAAPSTPASGTAPATGTPAP